MATAATPIKNMQEGETLHKFLDRVVRPDTGCIATCNEIVDKFVRFLENNNGPLVQEDKRKSIKRIVKSGSLGKGTAVRGKSDVDLIVFFNGFDSVRELSDDLSSVLRTIKSYVESNHKWSKDIKFKNMTPFSVQFYLKVEDDDELHEVDLLPAVDITESMSTKAIYEQMKDEESIRGSYSACLSPLQIKFLKQAPAKVKDLIRLLKYWAKVEDLPLRSYFLELLAIALWREDHKPPNFDMNKYFQQIMQQLSQIKTLAIAFDDNYNYRLYRSNLKSPYLLDPANPFRNVAPLIADVASITPKVTHVLERLG